MGDRKKYRTAELLEALCRELVDLARREEDAAASEATRTPYWSPRPVSAHGHRLAAQRLRAQVELLEAEVRSLTIAS